VLSPIDVLLARIAVAELAGDGDGAPSIMSAATRVSPRSTAKSSTPSPTHQAPPRRRSWVKWERRRAVA
jgi:hypothetical protein